MGNMKRLMTNRSMITTILLTLAACSSQPLAEDPGGRSTGPASLDREFRIGFGETLTLAGTDLRVTFDDLVESRCPTGVECVWEGSARVTLDVTAGSGGERLVLDTHPDLGPTGEALGYAFQLLDVDPFPVIDQPAPPEAHVATLIVSRAAE